MLTLEETFRIPKDIRSMLLERMTYDAPTNTGFWNQRSGNALTPRMADALEKKGYCQIARKAEKYGMVEEWHITDKALGARASLEDAYKRMAEGIPYAERPRSYKVAQAAPCWERNSASGEWYTTCIEGKPWYTNKTMVVQGTPPKDSMTYELPAIKCVIPDSFGAEITPRMFLRQNHLYSSHLDGIEFSNGLIIPAGQHDWIVKAFPKAACHAGYTGHLKTQECVLYVNNGEIVGIIMAYANTEFVFQDRKEPAPCGE